MAAFRLRKLSLIAALPWTTSATSGANNSRVKRIRFGPNVPAEVRAIERQAAMRILQALHCYAETGQGDIKALTGESERAATVTASARIGCYLMKRQTRSS